MFIAGGPDGHPTGPLQSEVDATQARINAEIW
jgi:hypothetical protein